ncbi:MAG: 7-cyano-7-deazaguanine synthase QueC [Gemmatimonadetes bacterium]|nr:7-cyano-7-deazaguanine synthase QueC [Gemmatimonadota bacterium]
MTDPLLAVVLVSGGLDSCVAAAIAARDRHLAFLHLNYHQRTEARELRAFEELAAHFQVSQRLIVDLSFMAQIGGSSLVDPGQPIPEEEEAGDQVPSTYVPFRNANLLGIAVAWAEVIGAADIFIGAHEEGSVYPDCRQGFFSAYNKAITAGTRPDSQIQVRTPLIAMDKTAIVRTGLELNAPLRLTWSCYQHSDFACGRCHSCRLRRRAFHHLGAQDPIPYAARHPSGV